MFLEVLHSNLTIKSAILMTSSQTTYINVDDISKLNVLDVYTKKPSYNFALPNLPSQHDSQYYYIQMME